MISFGLLSVCHEDGTVAYDYKGCGNVVEVFMSDEGKNEASAVLALHMTRNGQIMSVYSRITDHCKIALL